MKVTSLSVILIAMIAILPACNNASYCIAVDGSSDKYGIDEAGVEFCYNPQKSEVEQASVFVSPNGEEHFLVHRKYIERANAIIAKDAKVKATGLPKKETCMQEFTSLTAD